MPTGKRERWVVIDLDSTLAHTEHRKDCIPTPENGRTWWQYAERCLEDEPIRGAVKFARLMNDLGIKIYVLSARPEIALDDTEYWLELHEIPYHDITLAPERVKESVDIHTFKKLEIRYRQSLNRHFVLAVDDSVHAEEMYGELGIPCLTVMSWWARGVIEEHKLAQGV